MSLKRYMRIFDVIALLLRDKDGQNLTEIKEQLGLPISSLHNMLQTMVTAEVLTMSEDLRYFIGPRVVGIALATVASLDVRTLARRRLQALAKSIGDDVYLAMKIGERIMYVDRWIGTQRVSLDIRLGQPLMLHATATGKLFCAFDDRLCGQALGGPLPKLTANTISDAGKLEAEFKRIRARGYSKSNEEAVDGIVGYAVPVYDVDESIVAAIHASVLSRRATAEHERALISEALKSAEQIQRGLGNSRP
jgi:DNA-binding IclR family transcriptional regulator